MTNGLPSDLDAVHVGIIVTHIERAELEDTLRTLLTEAATDDTLSPEAKALAAADVEELSQGEFTMLAEHLPAISFGLTFVFGMAGGAFVKGFSQETGKIAAQELWGWLKGALTAKPGQVEEVVDAKDEDSTSTK